MASLKSSLILFLLALGIAGGLAAIKKRDYYEGWTSHLANLGDAISEYLFHLFLSSLVTSLPALSASTCYY